VTLPFPHVGVTPPSAFAAGSTAASAVTGEDPALIYKVSLLIRSYQVRGHRLANIDPLGLTPPPVIHDLEPSFYGFTEEDMKKEIDLGKIKLVSGFLAGSAGKRSLGDIIARLKQTYSSTIGIEYMHIQEVSECNWLRERIETSEPFSFSKDEKLVTLDRLMWAESFEKFLALKYPTSKVLFFCGFWKSRSLICSLSLAFRT
jgi:2-oxoglutarate dehydrogenase E1 component